MGRARKLDEEPDVSNRHKRWRVNVSSIRFIGAAVAILAAIIAWVIMAEKLQKVNSEYKKPFFITYWVHGFGYSVLYVAWKIWLLIPGNLSCNRVGEGVWRRRSRQLVIVSAFMSIISFTSAYSWYYSLPRTNIPANTAIYQSACVWVFILSIFLLHERVTVLKVAAVCVSVVGVVLVAVYSNNPCDDGDSNGSGSSDGSALYNSTANGSSQILGHIHRGGCTERSTPPGYIALFYSVVSYAVFEVSYKKWGSEEHDPASVFNSLRIVGYMGVHTLIWQWPGFIILHFSGLEPFEWPPYDIFILLLWNTILDIVFNAGLLICIALSSALFASIGTVLVIPAAILVDWMLQGFVLQTVAIFGVVLILLGFIGFVTSEVIALKTKDKTVGDVKYGRHLQPSVYQDDGGINSVWEEGEEGERESEEREEEVVLLLRSRKKMKRRQLILKYLF